MSITVRLWKEKELEKAQEDEWLATLLMNRGTFNEEEMSAYNMLPFPKRTFLAYWDDEYGTIADTTITAPNIKMLRKFLEAEYSQLPDSIIERVETYTPVKL